MSSLSQQFVLTVEGKARGNRRRRSQDQVARQVYSSLVVNSTLNDEPRDMGMALVKNMILLNFTDNNAKPEKN